MKKAKLSYNVYSFMGNYFDGLFKDLLSEDDEVRERFDFVQGREPVVYDLVFAPVNMSESLKEEVEEFLSLGSAEIQLLSWDITEFNQFHSAAKCHIDKKSFVFKLNKLSPDEIKRGLEEFEGINA